MPNKIISVQLSPNGKLASVLLDGQIHLVDIEKVQVVQKRSTDGQHTDALIIDSGIAYAIGQDGGQWIDPAFTRINLNTGELKGFSSNQAGHFYGTQKGIYADKLNKAFVHSYGQSPEDISYFNIDAKTDNVTTAGDSPYHGEYDVGTKLWLNSNQDLLLTNVGTYFYTNSLRYAGRLKIQKINQVNSSPNDDELLVTSYDSQSYYDDNEPKKYFDHYYTFSDFKFNTQKTFPLPLIENEQSYAISVFYSSTQNHVAIVQTGDATEDSSDILYYVITR